VLEGLPGLLELLELGAPARRGRQLRQMGRDGVGGVLHALLLLGGALLAVEHHGDELFPGRLRLALEHREFAGVQRQQGSEQQGEDGQCESSLHGTSRDSAGPRARG